MENKIIYAPIDFSNVNLGEKLNHEQHFFNFEGMCIREHKELSAEQKNIILNYPVVYVHTWLDSNNQRNVYIGETIDLIRRTDEHKKKGTNNDKEWQAAWLKGSNHKSFYFSHPEMNKSLALDLEDSLIALFEEIEDIKVNNGRYNKQKGYSNKHRRDSVLKEIIECFKQKNGLFSGTVNFDEKILNSITFSEGQNQTDFHVNDLVVFQHVIRNGQISENDIKAFLAKNTTDSSAVMDEKADLLLNYPVVYMHTWYDGKQHWTYVGEATDLIERTNQHISDPGFDMQNVLKSNWHESWSEAIDANNRVNEKPYAVMFAFGHKDMNVSVTRDIENLLISYTSILGKSVNGRGNEQREYNNRNIMHPLFKEIVNKISSGYGDIFDSLENIREKAMFMSSPLVEFSDEQKKAKDDILMEIHKSLSIAEDQKHSILIVEGSAGTGKTVLASSLFYDLNRPAKKRFKRSAPIKKLAEYPAENKIIEYGKNTAHTVRLQRNVKFIVNHEELFNAYSKQTEAYSLANSDKLEASVLKAETLINSIKYKYLNALLPFFCKDKHNELMDALKTDFITFQDKFKEFENYFQPDSWNQSHSEPKSGRVKWDNLKFVMNWMKDRGVLLPDFRIDVILVDEAHLLTKQGKSGGIAEAQLPILADVGKVVVLMFDRLQFLDKGLRWKLDDGQDWSSVNIESAYRYLLSYNNVDIRKICNLRTAFRMACSSATADWIKSWAYGNQIMKFPYDKGHYEKDPSSDNHGQRRCCISEYDKQGTLIYEIILFESCRQLAQELEEKKQNNNPTALIASYCWENRQDLKKISDGLDVFSFKWHNKEKSRDIWTMKPSLELQEDGIRFFEVGSYHDIQGFDLNYSGVILGKSIRLINDKICYSADMEDGGRQGQVGKTHPEKDDIIKNEIGVLLSRGKKGLYLYVCDENLREALFRAVE